MSDLSKKYDIEELLRKKVGNLQQAPSEDYWDNIDKGIAKARFYKFGWKHFNIYNLSAGIALIILLGSLFIFSFSKKTSDSVNPVELKNNEVIIESSIENSEKPSETDKQTIITKKQKQATANNASTSTAVEKYVIDSITNTTPVKEDKTPAVVEPEKKVAPRNKFYVYQTDTIIVDDTVKVKKRRKKK